MLSLQILQHKQRVTKEEAYSFIGLLHVGQIMQAACYKRDQLT